MDCTRVCTLVLPLRDSLVQAIGRSIGCSAAACCCCCCCCCCLSDLSRESARNAGFSLLATSTTTTLGAALLLLLPPPLPLPPPLLLAGFRLDPPALGRSKLKSPLGVRDIATQGQGGRCVTKLCYCGFEKTSERDALGGSPERELKRMAVRWDCTSGGNSSSSSRRRQRRVPVQWGESRVSAPTAFPYPRSRPSFPFCSMPNCNRRVCFLPAVSLRPDVSARGDPGCADRNGDGR